jgi:hypothetical protein
MEKACNPIRPDQAPKEGVLEWFQTLMFPDGYAANLRRGVNLTTMRINGLKSHDYHIWIERLLPMMVRGYLPDHIWKVLAELSYFFRILCAKELSKKQVKNWKKRLRCCFVSWRRSIHLAFSIRCST